MVVSYLQKLLLRIRVYISADFMIL